MPSIGTKTLSHLPLVCCIWRDAWGKDSGEYTASDIKKELHHPAIIKTFGLLIHDDEVGVTLAAEITSGDEDSDTFYRGLSFVPRGMVIEIIPLGTPKRKASKKGPAGGHTHKSQTPKPEPSQTLADSAHAEGQAL